MNEEQFLAARLRRVCRLTNLQSYAEMDDATLAGCAGTVLGMIASSIERSRAALSGVAEPVADERYCLGCEKLGHFTDECQSTHGLNDPAARELARLCHIAWTVKNAAPIEAEAQKAVAWQFSAAWGDGRRIWTECTEKDAQRLARTEGYVVRPLYAHPTSSASTEVVGLTDADAEIDSMNREAQDQAISGIAPSKHLALAIQRALAKKNGWQMGGE